MTDSCQQWCTENASYRQRRNWFAMYIPKSVIIRVRSQRNERVWIKEIDA
jgi:hypothetical protein